jgi:hypothetical protein
MRAIHSVMVADHAFGARSTPEAPAARGIRHRTRRWSDEVCPFPSVVGGDRYAAQFSANIETYYRGHIDINFCSGR